jgi:cytoskeleton protein RodZ
MSLEDNQQEQLAVTDEVAAPPSGAVKRSPGTMLKAQRETLELSVQQVAEKLNLTMHFVRCLEADSYDKLPEAVFVRGYIRTYSRLLGLDPDQLLMIYDEFNSHKIARKVEAIKRRKRRINDRNRPWIVTSGIAFIAVAVALWYLSPGASSENIADADDVVLASAASVLAASTNRVTTVADEAAIEVVAEVLRETGLQTQAEMTAESGVGEFALADVVPDETAQAQLAATVPEHTDSDVNHAAPHSEGGVSAPGESTLVQNWSGTDELRLTFKGESWVEVQHNGGIEEHAATRYAGESLMIYGTAPFAVLLGNARDVELSFNGRLIDISSNIRADNTARLSIGM